MIVRTKSNGDDRLAVITFPFLLINRNDGDEEDDDVNDLVNHLIIVKTIFRSANQNTAVQGLIGSTNAYIGLSDTATEVADDESILCLTFCERGGGIIYSFSQTAVESVVGVVFQAV